MATRIQLRRGTASEWTSANPTLSSGELGFETDTGKFKIGNGSTAWTSLSYASVTSSDVTTEVNAAIASLVDSAPGALNTLNELAAAINDDANFFTTVATNLSNHENDTTSIHGISNTANLVYTNDSRLSDARTPTSHASSHTSGGSDEITIAQSQVTNLSTDLSAKAPLSSPNLTGTPTAPTANQGSNSTQIATTAYVDTAAANAAAALVDSAPETLNTLNELAAALGDDPNYATSITTALGGKEPTITSGTTSQYWRGDKSWQTLDKTAVGLSNVENTALSTWSGSSSITTVGTLSSLIVSGLFTNYVTTNVQTGTSYILVLSDASKLIEMNNSSANTLTVPPNSSVAFPVGTKIDIIQTGAGETSIVAGSGVTINSDSGKLKLNAQWAAASLVKRATNTWVLIGALKA